ncbi:MAG: permease, partial [Desulfitobacteriaceae bacterium]|nr:permease [Desulfitobacteriaceae bacterium]
MTKEVIYVPRAAVNKSTARDIHTNERNKPVKQFLKKKGDISKGASDSNPVPLSLVGYLPEDLVLKFAGPDNPFAIPLAALIGIPLYIRVETAIPIGLSLMQKGMSVGAV